MFLEVETRLIKRLEQHLVSLGHPDGKGPIRQGMSGLGGLLAGLTSFGGELRILERLRSEESRGAERYGREADWQGWGPEERETVDGHRCDQLYQNQWAEDVERDLLREKA